MKLSRFASLAAVLVCALSISACANTIRGVGKDVKSTARAVEQAVTN
jgi:predicted small secreted protein